MSTWTSDKVRKLAKIALLGCVLTGCDDLETSVSGLNLFDPNPKSSEPVTRVELTAAKVSIGDAYGFCVEPRSVRRTANRASAVFGNCATISGNKDGTQPFSEAIVTATVTRISAAQASAFQDTKSLDAYLRSESGRAALSRSGKAETVKVLDSFASRRAVYIRVEDSTKSQAKNLNTAHWRSVFAMPEAAVFISARGLEGGTLSPAEELEVVREFTRRAKSGLAEDAQTAG